MGLRLLHLPNVLASSFSVALFVFKQTQYRICPEFFEVDVE